MTQTEVNCLNYSGNAAARLKPFGDLGQHADDGLACKLPIACFAEGNVASYLGDGNANQH
jgi:hypothetical protein